MEESCGYTADEYYANTHDDDDYSEGYVDAYNAQDEDEYEDSYPGYDTSGDWNDGVSLTPSKLANWRRWHT